MAIPGVNKLSLAETFKLGDLLRLEYLSSEMGDREFAAYAAEKLGFRITEHNVFGLRRSLGIEKPKPTTEASLLARVEALETLVAQLRREIAHCKGFDQRGVMP